MEFGNVKIKSIATDKGYYSANNEKILHARKVSKIGIPRPANIKKPSIKKLSSSRTQEFVDRRAGIEPLIGHSKHKDQLGRSRMKSDITNHASSYSAILGFNLRQMIRHKIGKFKEIERLKKSRRLHNYEYSISRQRQIRASMASNKWDYIWQETILSPLSIGSVKTTSFVSPTTIMMIRKQICYKQINKFN